jgi:hypothetical protein
MAGALDALKSFKPSMPSNTDIALSALGPLPSMGLHALEAYKRARAADQPIGESVAEGAAGLVGVNAPGVRERAQRGDIAGVLGEGFVPIAATLAAEPSAKAVGAAREAIRPVQQAAAESVVAPLTFEGGAESGADVRSGINPNRALASEKGMTGGKRALVGTPETAGKIGQRVTELKTAANQILDNHQYGDTPMDAGAHIDAAIDNAIARAEKIAGGTERLENLRQALRTKYGATQGTPRQMNDLASEIQKGASDLGAFKNTQPIEASAASAMRDAARRIRNNVNQIVPEAADINSRMADLLDAQSGVTHNLNAERGQSIFGGDRAGFWSSALNRTIGSAPVRTRIASMLNAGNKFAMPDATATMPAAPIPTRLGMGPTQFPAGRAPSPADAEFRDIPRNNEGVNVMPPSGRTIITPRQAVEIEQGAPELRAGPSAPQQLTGPEAPKALPPARQIQVGPSSLGPEGAPKPPAPETPKGPPTKGAVKAAREVMAQTPTTSRATPTGKATIFEGANGRLPPELHADLEKQAGRKLSVEDAVALDRANAEKGMAGGKGEDIGAIREEHRGKLEQKGRPEMPPSGVPKAEPFKPKATARSESLKTYNRLPAEVKEAVDAQAGELPHMPQALREARLRELESYGPKGTFLKEKLAQEAMKYIREHPESVEKTASEGNAQEIRRLQQRERELIDQSSRVRDWTRGQKLIRQAKEVNERWNALKTGTEPQK